MAEESNQDFFDCQPEFEEEEVGYCNAEFCATQVAFQHDWEEDGSLDEANNAAFLAQPDFEAASNADFEAASNADFEAEWDARMAIADDSNGRFPDDSDPSSDSETESSIPSAASSSGRLGAKRKRGGLADKRLQAIQVSAVDAVDSRIRACSNEQCCVKKLTLLDSSQRVHFVQSLQQIVHGIVGETVAVTKRQLLFAKHVFNTGNLFRISSTLMATFIIALRLDAASYPLQCIEMTLAFLKLSDFVVCALCVHALCNIRQETTRRAVELSAGDLSVEITARQTGHVAKSRRARQKFENALTFWLYWLTPEVANRPETFSEPIPGVSPYLRLLFSSYCAAYNFFLAAWDPTNGEAPAAGTSDAVLVMLGTNLNRRRRLLQLGYPDVPFIRGWPCRLRSFNKGELYRFLIHFHG
jgi:hypothetical protein